MTDIAIALTALSPQERSILDAINATGQGDGWLHDVSAIARRVGCAEEAVNAAVRSLHAKGYLLHAGISEESLAWAREQDATFRKLLRSRHAQGIPWQELGADSLIAKRLEQDTIPLRPETVARLADRAGLAANQVVTVRLAAALLYRRACAITHVRLPAMELKQIVCAVCKRPLAGIPRHGPRHPVCADLDCVCRWTKARIAEEGRSTFTERGGKLCDALLDRWGSLNKLRSATGIGTSTLHRWFFSPEFHPREAVLHLLAEAAGAPHETLYSWYGPTLEETNRRKPRRCPVCGQPLRNPHDGWMCSTLARVVRRGFRTDLGRLICALMAAAVKVPPDRIAALVGAPLPTARSWLRHPTRAQTVVGIRSRITGNDLLPATAAALGISRKTLSGYLRGLYRWGGRRRAVPPRFLKCVHIAPMLGLTEGELLRMGGVEDSAIAYAHKHMGEVREQKMQLGRGKPQGILRGPRFSTCTVVRDAARKDAGKAPLLETQTVFASAGVESVNTLSQVRDYIGRHARAHGACLSSVAAIYVKAGWSRRATAHLLSIAPTTVGKVLTRRPALMELRGVDTKMPANPPPARVSEDRTT